MLIAREINATFPGELLDSLSLSLSLSLPLSLDISLLNSARSFLSFLFPLPLGLSWLFFFFFFFFSANPLSDVNIFGQYRREIYLHPPPSSPPLLLSSLLPRRKAAQTSGRWQPSIATSRLFNRRKMFALVALVAESSSRLVARWVT